MFRSRRFRTGLAALALLLPVAALADLNSTLKELNAAIAAVLQPFQSNNTTAELTFKNIATNAERALALELAMTYKKVGGQNTLELSLNDLSYNYGDGSAPTTKASGTVGFDFSKILSQEEIQAIVPDLEKMLQQAAQEQLQTYGTAATAEVKIYDKETDENGNYVAAKGSALFTVDLNNLPQGVDVKSVPFTELRVNLGVGVKTGLTFDVTLVSNPQYSAFDNDKDGLKEGLDKLLAQDPETIQEIGQLFALVDMFANQAVNQKSE